MHKAPHPDEIIIYRRQYPVSYKEAKWALGKGFKYPVMMNYDEAAKAYHVLKGEFGSVRGLAEVHPKTPLHRKNGQWILSLDKRTAVWFRDEGIATYVKLMI